jgi:hypothetical protein
MQGGNRLENDLRSQIIRGAVKRIVYFLRDVSLA